MAIVLTGGAVLTVNATNEFLPAADIRIEGDTIAALGPADSLARPGDTLIDCSEALITPGLVNVHTHAATAFYRGMAEDQPREFWSAGYAMPGQESFTVEDHVLSVRAACAEFLLNGVTCIADRLSNMDRIAPGIEASGIRAVVGHSLVDARAPADWKTADAVIERYGTDPRRRVFAGIAPHALDTCSDALLTECARRAEKTGARVFIHVAQNEPEVAAVRRRGHDGALACLVATGLAAPSTVAAHAIYLSDTEFEAWPAHGIAIAHCPASNLKIEARTLPLARLAGRVPIGLGTDWTASNNAMDMLAEARLAALVGKSGRRPAGAAGPTDGAHADHRRRAGARPRRAHRQRRSGQTRRSLLVVFDGNKLEATPAHDPAANLIYSLNPRTVRDVLVYGGTAGGGDG